MKAVVMNGTGGREMLEHVERPDPVTGPGQALVDIAFAGVNFMDIGVRQGMAWTDTPNPKVLGGEGVGRVVAVGDGVEGIAPGQRVAWVYAPGSYAERIAIPAASLVPVPDAIDASAGASCGRLVSAHLEGLPVDARLDRGVVGASFAIEGLGAASLLEATRVRA